MSDHVLDSRCPHGHAVGERCLQGCGAPYDYHADGAVITEADTMGARRRAAEEAEQAENAPTDRPRVVTVNGPLYFGHPVQYAAVDNVNVINTEHLTDDQVRHVAGVYEPVERFDRCPTCQESAPCAVRRGERTHEEAEAERRRRLDPAHEWYPDDAPLGTSGGEPITEEMIKKAAAEAEAGYDPDSLSPVTYPSSRVTRDEMADLVKQLAAIGTAVATAFAPMAQAAIRFAEAFAEAMPMPSDTLTLYRLPDGTLTREPTFEGRQLPRFGVVGADPGERPEPFEPWARRQIDKIGYGYRELRDEVDGIRAHLQAANDEQPPGLTDEALIWRGTLAKKSFEELDRLVGNEEWLDPDETAKVRGIIQQWRQAAAVADENTFTPRSTVSWDERGMFRLDLDSGAVTHHDAERMRAQLDRIREMCDARRVDSVGGGQCDVQEIWPQEILDILDPPDVVGSDEKAPATGPAQPLPAQDAEEVAQDAPKAQRGSQSDPGHGPECASKIMINHKRPPCDCGASSGPS